MKRTRRPAPAPPVTAPRPMTDQQSRAPGWRDTFSDVIRRADGQRGPYRDDDGQFHIPPSQLVPTYSGPGDDMRSHAGDDDTYLQRMMNQHNAFPTIVPDTHRELMETEIPEAARTSLDALGQDVHNAFELGTGDYNIDEYSMVMDELPAGFDTPEEFLAAFLRDPNGFANDQSATWNPFTTEGLVNDFDFYNEFDLRQAGSNDGWSSADPNAAPGVGDWYHIDIPGNDGDVMIVDTQDNEERTAATVQTMTDQEFGPGNDDHPVSGRRQFGMERTPDGAYRFYTRGFDRQTTGLMDVQASNAAQHGDWQSLMRAMAEEHGGRAERTDENGQPIWGWAEQVPLDALTSSMVSDPVFNDNQMMEAAGNE